MINKLKKFLFQQNPYKEALKLFKDAKIEASMYGESNLTFVPNILILQQWLKFSLHKDNTCTIRINGVLLKAIKQKSNTWSCHTCYGETDTSYTKPLHLIINSEF